MFLCIFGFASVSLAITNNEAVTSTGFSVDTIPAGICHSEAGQVSVKDYMKVWHGTIPGSWFTFRLENALYKLKFYPDMPTGRPSPILKDAIKAFQSSINAKPTGTLLVCEWVQLVNRVNQLFPRQVYPSRIYPVKLAFSKTDQRVDATGTWQLQQTPVEFPFLQTSNIRCFKQANTCVEANAMIIDEVDFKSSVERDYLTVGTIIWQVDRWNKQEIVANNNVYPCLRASLYVNLMTDSVYKLYRFYPDSPGCKQYSNKKPHIFDLVDGLSYAKSYYRTQDQTQSAFYNPEFLRRIKAIQGLSR